MKVLVINGSPKGEKSNTLHLTKAFLAGTGAQDVETLHVSRLNIDSCRGCFACWNKTPGKCVISDDMEMVLSQILAADLIVWSFPLYYFSIPGKLKTLIDRQLPLALPFMVENTDGSGSGSHPSRYDMSGKRYVLISTCGFYSAEKNYDAVERMFDHICGKDNYETIFCGQGELFRVPQLRNRTDAYLADVQQAGAEFMTGGIRPETRERLKTLLFPKEVFEEMADASWGVEKSAGEHQAPVDETLAFTRQMAALYRKESFDGKARVLEMHYTDRDKTYQILMERDGYKMLDDPKDFQQYTTRIETPFTVWLAISEGKTTGPQAMMEQKYRVDGDFSLMLKWDDFFGYAAPAAEKKPATAKTASDSKSNMLIFLLPWILFWTVTSFNEQWGVMTSIAFCALIPLLWLKFKSTIYERLTIACISGLSLSLLLGADQTILWPLSYLLFGLLWFVSGFQKIPLSAYYSMNDYNGEKALQNPLFMKTNRILSLGWGVLYLVISVWSFLLMRANAAGVALILNNVATILMGIFTVWYQKWYPAKVARGR